MSTLLILPLLAISLVACVVLWHRCDCGDGFWDDVWAMTAIAPLLVVIITAVLT